MSLRSYRETLTRPVLAWGAVAVGARMPVAMAPLALVFLVREQPGGYALGAVLAAAYVVGEIAGAPVLGMRLRAERARPQLASGLAVGAAAFAGLGALPGAHPVVLGALAFLAGAAPAAAPGGLRALLTSLVPVRSAPQALSVESMLTFAIWAVSPAVATGLALGAAPPLALLLAAVLMAASVAGLWALPAGWSPEDADGDGKGEGYGAMLAVLARAWPLYVTGAASMTLLALAELILPALLEQRGIALGFAGPLLAALAVGSAAGSFLYGLRSSWPGRLSTQSSVLLLVMAGCLVALALAPSVWWIGLVLVCAGVLESGVMLARNLLLRETLPANTLAAGYSVMYAAVGAGYAAAGTLSGALLNLVEPSEAMLAGVVLILALTATGAAGERSARRRGVRNGTRAPQGAEVVPERPDGVPGEG
ncbi:MFS transporter [Streptomyces sp. HNM0574]|uniref:MFS transporter n=1 Tax=Streptomyces sp. HNM0574 TaxID=2714954 RepID=UPI00146EA45C|nr:MFS transporter [Streptomyces sp. HNM0574]NLU69449.1 MFS transporter [Streptomyces sp. HNM0574]